MKTEYGENRTVPIHSRIRDLVKARYIVRHSIIDITEKIYTDRTFDWIRTEIEKIK